MDSSSPDRWLEIKGPFTAKDLAALGMHESIYQLSITGQPLVTASVAKGLSKIKAVDRLWLWCDVTRTAMKYVVAIPKLRILDVLLVKPPGRLAGFSAAMHLQEFRCPHCLNETDLLEISSCISLRKLGAQGCQITPAALDALLGLRHLESLDLEGSNFNDQHAMQLRGNKSLRHLDIGSTAVTRKGIGALIELKHLRELDLWATRIEEQDLDLLAELPHLEYLSVGQGYDNGKQIFSPATLLPRLTAMPSLKRVWLDGVVLSASEKAAFEKHFEELRVTCD